MPQKNARSKQAKAQRASGKRGFDSGFTEDPFEKLHADPDYNPDMDEGLADTEIEDEFDTNYAFSLYEEEETEGDKSTDSNTSEVQVDSELDSEHSDYEEQKAHYAAERIQQEVRGVS